MDQSGWQRTTCYQLIWQWSETSAVCVLCLGRVSGQTRPSTHISSVSKPPDQWLGPGCLPNTWVNFNIVWSGKYPEAKGQLFGKLLVDKVELKYKLRGYMTTLDVPLTVTLQWVWNVSNIFNSSPWTSISGAMLTIHWAILPLNSNTPRLFFWSFGLRIIDPWESGEHWVTSPSQPLNIDAQARRQLVKFLVFGMTQVGK